MWIGSRRAEEEILHLTYVTTARVFDRVPSTRTLSRLYPPPPNIHPTFHRDGVLVTGVPENPLGFIG